MNPEAKYIYQGGEVVPSVGTPEYTAAQNSATQALNRPVPVTNDAGDLGQSNPLKIPPTTAPTGFAATNDYITGINNTIKTDIQKDLANKQALQEAEVKTNKSTLSTIYDKIAGMPARKEEIYKEEKVDPARKQVDELTSQIEAEEVALRRSVEEVNKRAGGTIQGKNDEIGRLTRESVSKRADLAVIQNAALRRYDTARAIADRKIEAELEPLKLQLDATKFFYSENKDDLTKTEQRLFETYMIDEERKYNEAKDSKEKLRDVKLELLQMAGSQGAPSSVQIAIQNATTPEDAIRAAGQYSGDMMERETQRLQQQKLINEIANNQPITGEWASVINGALSITPASSKAGVKQAIAGALAEGKYDTAYAEIANAVEGALTGTSKTNFADARTDIGVLSGLRTAIQNYTDAGGDIGFLKGSADSIAKKFGQLATDPKFASLAVQLEREFQSYRNNMTGAAFSPEESGDYAKVNPRSNATLDLNLATIDGALNQLTNRVTSTINARVPDAKKIQEKIEDGVATKASATAESTAPKLSNDDAYSLYLKQVNSAPVPINALFR